MKTTKEVRQFLREAKKKITSGFWGRYGNWNNKPPQPYKGVMEAAPGLTIGATGNVEPIARISGYKHDVEANADFITVAINHIGDLLDDLDELEEENEILIDRIKRMESGILSS